MLKYSYGGDLSSIFVFISIIPFISVPLNCHAASMFFTLSRIDTRRKSDNYMVFVESWYSINILIILLNNYIQFFAFVPRK